MMVIGNDILKQLSSLDREVLYQSLRLVYLQSLGRGGEARDLTDVELLHAVFLLDVLREMGAGS